MRVKIEYYYNKNASPEFPFWARAKHPDPKIVGDVVLACGTSWDDARSKIRQKLADIMASPEPPLPEEIEI
jgi:hypothetical protein